VQVIGAVRSVLQTAVIWECSWDGMGKAVNAELSWKIYATSQIASAWRL
jgi:hypothetical protein